MIVINIVSCGKKEIRYFSPERMTADMEHFRKLNTQKLKFLTQYGVNESSNISLEFYFATDDSLKAQGLVSELPSPAYHFNKVHRSSKDKKLWVISGSGPQIKMDLQALTTWTNKLCEIGYAHDCELLGWNPVAE
ncbi:MAG: ribonuclease E inhibitor RraB [Chitinophagales bacterium]|nr:ribonuclease E inhibitor RraB [Chitinophagales bacterium]